MSATTGFSASLAYLNALDRALDAAVVDRHQPHARHAVDDLIGEPARHEAGADHADADRLAFRFAALAARCRR